MKARAYLNAQTKNLRNGILKTGDLLKIESDSFPFIYHYGIVQREGDKIFIYHNHPDKKNKLGGNLLKEDYKEYIRGKILVEVQSLGIKEKDFIDVLAELKDKKYNVFTNNCEHLINKIKYKRSISPQVGKWGLGIAIVISGYLLIRKK